jgi:lysozyme
MTARHVAVGGVTAALTAIALNMAVPNIKELEGRRNVPYYDVVKVLSVCDGHTGKDIVVKRVYSDAECDALTLKDVQKYVDGILAVSPHLAYHPMQFAATISFTYNVGVAGYQRSTVAVLFNKGDLVGACNFMMQYKKPPQIIGRRQKERALCLSTLTP